MYYFNQIKIQGQSLFLLLLFIAIMILLLTVIGGKADIKELNITVLHEVLRFTLKK
ncbi:MAG: hypothetical protein UR68_C0013G0035 [Candidatus Roizmanbacteria bacterium GW2011_GWA2_35_19]|uniref:Uncharacterized protein n=2 Tax=Candidatus Roizmaniibacteriota TaxID=1752723 RepID=A0A0G0F035_9BACT|nr:MAG: hypothetical protein UR63_C0020G0037 [Candidatus Roizmanbacteria bacterium GW2011_GWC2_35_12]KKP72722.1 MAG: hypothetical protein UR68_C0013G0035 [Candidatus Roizmanbacteria bacterium GW2011_GWA2_35_19]